MTAMKVANRLLTLICDLSVSFSNSCQIKILIMMSANSKKRNVLSADENTVGEKPSATLDITPKT